MKKAIFFVFIFAALFTGCKAPQMITIHEIQYKDRIYHDTLTTVQRDSIRITQKGDTVYFQSFKTLYKDRIVIKTDSVLKYVEKPVPVEKIKEVEKKLNWIQSLFIKTGLYVWIAFIILIIILIVKNYINIKSYWINLLRFKK